MHFFMFWEQRIKILQQISVYMYTIYRSEPSFWTFCKYFISTLWQKFYEVNVKYKFCRCIFCSQSTPLVWNSIKKISSAETEKKNENIQQMPHTVVTWNILRNVLSKSKVSLFIIYNYIQVVAVHDTNIVAIYHKTEEKAWIIHET